MRRKTFEQLAGYDIGKRLRILRNRSMLRRWQLEIQAAFVRRLSKHTDGKE